MASTDCSLEKKQQDLRAAQDELLMCRLRGAKLLLQRNHTRLEREKLAEREIELEKELAREAARRKNSEDLVRSLEEDIVSYTQVTSQIDKMKARIGELETSASALKAEVRELEKKRETKQVMCPKIADDARAETASVHDGQSVGSAKPAKDGSNKTQLVQPSKVPASARRGILLPQKRQLAYAQMENGKIKLTTAKEFHALMRGPGGVKKHLLHLRIQTRSTLNNRPRFKLVSRTENTNDSR